MASLPRPRSFQSAGGGYSRVMSLTDLKTAVDQLPPGDLAELAAFVRERETAVWDQQIDGDFADDGRLRSVLEEVRADLRAGRMEEMP